MNEQDSKRDQRGDTSRQSTVQPEAKAGEHFLRNGFEIFSFDSKAIVSWGLLSGLVGLVLASVTVYRSFGSQVDERIVNHRELNRKLDKHDFEIQNLKEDSKESKQRITDVERYLNTRGKK